MTVRQLAFLSLVASLFLCTGNGSSAAPDLFAPVNVDMPIAAGGDVELIDTGTPETLHGIAFGNGKYIAVGNGGTILYSENLRSWSQATIEVEANLTGVAFGHGRFAATGDDALLLSTDGISWEPVSLGNLTGLRTIIFGDNRFVALSTENYALVSNDGITWTSHTTEFSEYFTHIVYGDGRYFAAGIFRGIYSSPDGKVWTEIPGPHPAIGLTYGDDRWVRTALDRFVAVSSDGENWAQFTISDMNRIKISSGNGLFLAIGAVDKRVFVSADGERWHRRFSTQVLQGRNPAISNLFFVNERFVAPYADGHLYVFEKDRPSEIVAMAEAAGRIYAVDSLGRIVAGNGDQWETISDEFLPDPLALAVLDSETVVIVGGNGMAAALGGEGLRHFTLPTHQYPGVPDNVPDDELPKPRVYRFVSGIAHDGQNRFVAVGANGAILYTDDLEEWIHATVNQEVNSGRTFRDIAYGKGIFIAAGYDGTILHSDDGEHWNVSTENLGDSLAGVAFGKERFVIVGKSGIILVSDDGERWLRHGLDTPHALTSVSASTQGFLIGGWEGRIFRSQNARKWEEIPLGTTVSVTAVGGNHAGLADGTLLEIQMPPSVPTPADDGFFSRWVEPGDALALVFPEAVSQGNVTYQWFKDGTALPGEDTRSLELPAVTRRHTGTYRLRATGTGGSTFTNPITVAIPFDYETWLVERSPFTESELADPGITAPLAKPFADNITNLARYGFDLENVGDVRGLPSAGIQIVDGYGFKEHYLTLTFSRPAGVKDVEFSFESSENLAAWSTLEDWKTISSQVRGETEWVTIRDSVGLTDGSNRFLRTRLRQTLPGVNFQDSSTRQ